MFAFELWDAIGRFLRLPSGLDAFLDGRDLLFDRWQSLLGERLDALVVAFENAFTVVCGHGLIAGRTRDRRLAADFDRSELLVLLAQFLVLGFQGFSFGEQILALILACGERFGLLALRFGLLDRRFERRRFGAQFLDLVVDVPEFVLDFVAALGIVFELRTSSWSSS